MRAKRGPISDEIVGRGVQAKGEVAERKVQGSMRRAAIGGAAEGEEDESPPWRRRANVTAQTTAVWRGSRVGGRQGVTRVRG